MAYPLRFVVKPSQMLNILGWLGWLAPDKLVRRLVPPDPGRQTILAYPPELPISAMGQAAWLPRTLAVGPNIHL